MSTKMGYHKTSMQRIDERHNELVRNKEYIVEKCPDFRNVFPFFPCNKNGCENMKRIFTPAGIQGVGGGYKDHCDGIFYRCIKCNKRHDSLDSVICCTIGHEEGWDKK